VFALLICLIQFRCEVVILSSETVQARTIVTMTICV